MSNQDLPVKATEDFIADIETMDLSAIKGETFLVAVSTGDRNKGKFLSTTVRGPYTFPEMCEEVGTMWREQNHHAKVVICQKNRKKGIKTLDENAVDYIEANFADLIVESMLEGALDDKEYTCRVGVVDHDLSEEPKQEKAKPVEEDEDL